MSLTQPWKLDKIVLPSSVEFSVLRTAAVSPEIESMLAAPAGHPFPMFRANARYKPVVRFTTSQIDVALAACGMGGLAITAASYVYWKAATVTGSIARATTSHRRFVVNKGFLYWTSLRAPHNGKAELDMVLCCAYDGTNDPIVAAGSVALSGSLAAGNFFGLGPQYINGAQLNGNVDLTVNTGVREFREGADSEPFDTFVGLEMGQPTADLTYLDGTALHDMTLDGTILNGSTGWLGYLRKYLANDDRVANATAEHVYLQMLLGSVLVREDSGTEAGLNRASVRIEGVASSDTVLPLVVATSQAIP